MQLDDVIKTAVSPALQILPGAMDSAPARVMLLAIGLQESGFQARQQLGGPAHGYWQFEQGTAASRGGVWGVYLSNASSFWLKQLCVAQGVPFDPVAIYGALLNDDVLAAGVARLTLFTDPLQLPGVSDVSGSWNLYQRVWRPGKPRPETWPSFHQQAASAIAAKVAQ